MKKKIGVVTIFDASGNIGNKLQNYAVVKTYERLGYECHTLATEKRVNFLVVLKFTILNWARFIIKHKKKFNPYNFKRVYRFEKFNSLLNVDYSLIKGSSLDYDCYSVGSDQVWNPNFYRYDERRKSFYFLTFTECKTKIAFSPSFSIDSIPNEWKEWFTNKLNTFSALSVREETGVRIIKNLTGKDATLLVDPTMLLSCEDWRKISKRPNKVNREKYFLTYFLSSKCDEAKELINELNEKMTKYEILNPDDKAVGNADPAEFLWLVEHAEIILTDSFHASVFSFLFNKPFIVYDRKWNKGNINSRLVTLLSKFHIERKYASSGLGNDIWEHDYSEGYKQLENERKKAKNYLKEALED